MDLARAYVRRRMRLHSDRGRSRDVVEGIEDTGGGGTSVGRNSSLLADT